ncbi:MAG: ATP-dependent RecD-like DNA helicase [Clostridia bacterium]|nr:ATP-dependent RecD-like DNA helicase [Clostridia bacterium]
MPDTVLNASMVETIFRNEENGYSVVAVRAGREEVTVVGVMPALAAGEQVAFTGVWIEHPQYGRQFKAAECRIQKPTTLLGIERFLASGLIKGVGPATARTIVEAFGEKTLDVLSGDVERLASVKGIGAKRAKSIVRSFNEQYSVRQTMIYLQSYGVAPSLAMKLSKAYGDQVESVMRTNPYRMIDDIDGAGFMTADRIALSMGLRADSEFRLQYGIKYILQEAASGSGHTYLPREMLTREAAALLKCPRETIDHHLQQLLIDRALVSAVIDGVEGIFLSSVHYTEIEVAARLIKLSLTADAGRDKSAPKKIRAFEKDSGITFSDRQREAVLKALENGVMVITGGPGTGKTTIINCILSLLSEEGEVLLAAPTGRAAKRMSEATGQEAKTIHRLLEYSGEEEHFLRNQDHPLSCSCVIVDEMSMVDIFLMRSLLRALQSGTRLILVGDADQLPSVGAGNVLRDILDSGAIPSARLTDIFRQAGESMIVLNAHRINQGEMPVLNRRDSDFFFDRRPSAEDAARAIVSLCAVRLPAYLNVKDGVRAIQVLAPAKKGSCGVLQLNKLLQEALNPPLPHKKETVFGDTLFREGDKVMHVKNDYQLAWTSASGEEGTGVFNGDVGFITAIDPEEHTVSVLYDDERTVEYEYAQLEELELAYCVSVHKSQGSEFKAVVIPVTGGPKMLLTRNLFYTALTRARELVVLVGSERVIAEMVENNYISTRYTALGHRIRELTAPAPPQML